VRPLPGCGLLLAGRQVDHGLLVVIVHPRRVQDVVERLPAEQARSSRGSPAQDAAEAEGVEASAEVGCVVDLAQADGAPVIICCFLPRCPLQLTCAKKVPESGGIGEVRASQRVSLQAGKWPAGPMGCLPRVPAPFASLQAGCSPISGLPTPALPPAQTASTTQAAQDTCRRRSGKAEYLAGSMQR